MWACSSYINHVLTMPAITDFVLEGSNMENTKSSDTQSQQETWVPDSMDFDRNPDIVPFQPANFFTCSAPTVPAKPERSSTILKKVLIPKRHPDMFGGCEYNSMGQRGVMLHTDRYQVDFIKSFDCITQRERLQAGLDYMETMRGTRRKREMVPHRAKLDLIMGGKQIEFEERFDLARELQKLKAIAMPKHARDLFHGRGIHLPNNHLSVHPRFPMPNDFEDEGPTNFPHRLQAGSQQSIYTTQLSQDVPVLGNLDRASTSIQFKGGLARSKSKLQRHGQLPSIRTSSDTTSKGLHRNVTSLSRSHTQAPPPTRDQANDPASLITRGMTGPATVAKRKPAALGLHVPGGGTKRLGRFSKTETADASVPVPGTQGAGLSEVPPVSGAAYAPVLPQIVPTTADGRHTPNAPRPHRGADLITSVPQDEQESLRQTFERLDTDADGHIKYQQLQSQLPKHFSLEQERFIDAVYEISNSITFFGIEEFIIMDRLSNTVEHLTDQAVEAFTSLDFSSLNQDLLKYLGHFDEADSGNRGKISQDALREILSKTVTSQLTTDDVLWGNVQNLMSTESSLVSKIEYIAHVPQYLNLEKYCKF